MAELKVKQKYEREDAIQEEDEYFSEESGSSGGEQPAPDVDHSSGEVSN